MILHAVIWLGAFDLDLSNYFSKYWRLEKEATIGHSNTEDKWGDLCVAFVFSNKGWHVLTSRDNMNTWTSALFMKE